MGSATEHHSTDALLDDSQAVKICATGATVLGVDVSDGQQGTNWTEVKGDNRLFSFIKATEGVTFTSPTFATDWAGTQSAGVFRSAYHFFRPQDDGVAQAQNYLNVVGANQTGNLPPMLDVEVTDNEPAATIVARLKQWLTTVQAATGMAPIIYTSPSFWDSTLGAPSGFSQYPLYIANWQVSCPNIPTGWNNWTFWQSTDSETVTGINGAVDGDSFNGTTAQLAALTGQPACVPQCNGATCGSDGCGGSCGTCASGQTCSSGQCVSTSTCAHPICSPGVNLTSSCDPCATQVCGSDPYCCTTQWDRICIGEVTSICGQTCP